MSYGWIFLFFVIAVALFNMMSAYVDSMFNIKN